MVYTYMGGESLVEAFLCNEWNKVMEMEHEVHSFLHGKSCSAEYS